MLSLARNLDCEAVESDLTCLYNDTKASKLSKVKLFAPIRKYRQRGAIQDTGQLHGHLCATTDMYTSRGPITASSLSALTTVQDGSTFRRFPLAADSNIAQGVFSTLWMYEAGTNNLKLEVLCSRNSSNCIHFDPVCVFYGTKIVRRSLRNLRPSNVDRRGRPDWTDSFVTIEICYTQRTLLIRVPLPRCRREMFTVFATV